MVLDGDTDRLTGQSMLHDEIEMELTAFNKELIVLRQKLDDVVGDTNLLAIHPDTVVEYETLMDRLETVSGNQAKKVKRDVARMKAVYPTIADFAIISNNKRELEKQIDSVRHARISTEFFISDSLSNVSGILVDNSFIMRVDPDVEVDVPTDVHIKIAHTGRLASIVRETHPLAFVDTYVAHNGFRAMDARAATIFLCTFIEIRGADDEDRLYEQTMECSDGSVLNVGGIAGTATPSGGIAPQPTPSGIGSEIGTIPQSVLRATNTYKARCEHYATQETQYRVSVPDYKRCRVGHVDLYARWYDAEDELTAKRVLADAASRGIFAGDFVKGVMSVVALAREVEMVCDLDANLETKSHMCAVGDRMLKFIATNQSLYV